jgi:hypothetical protein
MTFTSVLTVFAIAMPSVAMATEPVVSPPEPVQWLRMIGSSPVAGSPGTLVKTAASSDFDSGAVSTRALSYGEGSVAFTAVETSKGRVCGLSHRSIDYGPTDMDFAIRVGAAGRVTIWESGSNLGDFGPYHPYDRFRIDVSPGAVRYWQGQALLHTSYVTPQYPLVVDTSLRDLGATLERVELSGALATAAQWTSRVGVAVEGPTLVKTGPTAEFDSGALSTHSIVSGDGFVEFSAAETDKGHVCGLGRVGTSQDLSTIDFAIRLGAAGRITIWEAGVRVDDFFGEYTPADRFRIEIVGGVVRYRRNDELLHVSAVSPTYPLRGHASLKDAGARLVDVQLGGSLELATMASIAVNNRTSSLDVAPGASVSVSVQGPGNPTDWVGLFPIGATDDEPLVRLYFNGSTTPPPVGVTDATLAFDVPTAPGVYQFRCFVQDEFTRIAHSAPLFVQFSDPAGTLSGATEPESIPDVLAYQRLFETLRWRRTLAPPGAAANPTGWGLTEPQVAIVLSGLAAVHEGTPWSAVLNQVREQLGGEGWALVQALARQKAKPTITIIPGGSR